MRSLVKWRRSALVILSLLFRQTCSFGVLTPSLSKRIHTQLDATPYKTDGENGNPTSLKVAVVGGGPSGLLLAHLLLEQGHSVSIMERRNDVRKLVESGGGGESSRAYALGIGIRGRTAIRQAGDAVWNAVEEKGYPSERFTLCINSKLKIRLRDRAKQDKNGKAIEPSLLLYQTDLCSALLEQLEERYKNSTRYSIKFNASVERIDLETKLCVVSQADTDKSEKLGPFDVIAGCDGVNSIVRDSIDSKAFQQNVTLLPGQFKVCRCTSIPPMLDPTSVSLLLPKKGGITAFVEPTRNGGGCILFAGRQEDDPIFAKNPQDLDIIERYPLLDGIDVNEVISQLSRQEASRASSVRCNAYHYKNLVLCGDAAHATGGVSGQGVNSALADASALAACLDPSMLQHGQGSMGKDTIVQQALLAYSQSQVPEGKALYELFFGDGSSTSIGKRIRSALATARDAIFQGKLGIGRMPLQTLLVSSLTPFADIRRDRDGDFDTTFPTAEEWNESLADLYK